MTEKATTKPKLIITGKKQLTEQIQLKLVSRKLALTKSRIEAVLTDTSSKLKKP